jgi:hypothetical protein
MMAVSPGLELKGFEKGGIGILPAALIAVHFIAADKLPCPFPALDRRHSETIFLGRELHQL